jgi:hypothetical protein
MAKIEEEAASDLLEEKIGNLNTLKEEVQVWEAKFKVRRLKKILRPSLLPNSGLNFLAESANIYFLKG